MLIFIFIVLYVVLAVIRLDWAVMLILVAMPTYLIRWQIFGIPFTLLEAMILTSFFIWFITKTEFRNFIRGKYSWKDFKSSRAKRIPYPFGLEIILLLIVSFIAVAISGFSDVALGVWKAYFFEPVLFFILMLNLFVDKDNGIQATKSSQPPLAPPYIRRGTHGIGFGIEKILWTLAVSALAVSALAIYQKITGDLIFNKFWADSATRRVVSFFGYPNAVGLYLGPLVMIMMGWLFKLAYDYKKFGWKILNFKFQISNKFSIFNFQFLKLFFIILTIATSLLAVYFAKSKGAVVGVGFGLIIFAIFAGGKKIRWAVLGLLLITIIGISVYAPLRNYTLDKTIYSKSIQIRRIGWRETKTMLKDGRIISGAGLANYQSAVAPYHQEGVFIEDYRDPDWLNKIRASAGFRQEFWQPLEIYLYPHNIFLNFWSELGLAGLLLFIWIIGKYLVFGIKYLVSNGDKKYLVIGLIGAMVVVVVHGLVDVPYFKNDLAVMFWVLVALMSMCCIKHNK